MYLKYITKGLLKGTGMLNKQTHACALGVMYSMCLCGLVAHDSPPPPPPGTIVQFGAWYNEFRPEQNWRDAACGDAFTVALREDGSVSVVGEHNSGGFPSQDLALPHQVPRDLPVVAKVSAGADHVIALTGSGSVVCWGVNTSGACDVPEGLTDVVGIAAGAHHSVALSADGNVVCWGESNSGQCDVPQDLPECVAVAAGPYHSLAITVDGHVWGWGDNSSGQCDAPAEVTNAVKVVGGRQHSAALLVDGSVVCWGSDFSGQCTPPLNMPSAMDIDASGLYTLAVLQDGTLATWGEGPATEGVPEEAGFARVFSGTHHAAAQKVNGEFVAWGLNDFRQCNLLSDIGDVDQFATGINHILYKRTDGALGTWGSPEDTNPCGKFSHLSIPEHVGLASEIDAGRYVSAARSLSNPNEVTRWGGIFFPHSGGCVVTTEMPEVQFAAGSYFWITWSPDGIHDVTNSYYGACGNQEHWAIPLLELMDSLGAPIKLEIGQYAMCAMFNDDVLRCWSLFVDGCEEPTLPSEFHGVADFDVGGTHVVLLLDTGEVITAEETCCWSESNYGELDVPKNLTDITQIYAEGARSGALDGSGRLHLWGWDDMVLDGFTDEGDGEDLYEGVYEGRLNAVPPQLGKISRADIQTWSTYAQVMFTDCDNDGIHDPQACYDGTVADTNENYVSRCLRICRWRFSISMAK